MTRVSPCGKPWHMPRIKLLKDTQHITLRVNTELLEKVQKHADENHRTLSQEIRLALVKHVKAATETA